MDRKLGWGARLLCVGGLVLPACVGEVGGDQASARAGASSDAFDPGTGVGEAGEECDSASELCGEQEASASPNFVADDEPPPGCDPEPEDCANGVDDDCDGRVDDNDPDCDPPSCSPVAEGCNNGIDDDCDGLVDDEDPDCDPPSCSPVAEGCNNGIDDDCDGLVDGEDPDCECIWSTEACAIPDCNNHPGDNQQACYAAGNAGNCTPQQLLAWCTRRIDEGPGGLWYQIHQQWVDGNCSGQVLFQDINGIGLYTCDDDDSCTHYQCQTPLVLIFDTTSAVTYWTDEGSHRFDLSPTGDGSATQVDWPTSATPWLAIDRDGDGRISSGRELFGSASPTLTGVAHDGFEALAELDANDDQVIDRRDPGYDALLIWSDANHDRISQPEELTSLNELGVSSLSLTFGRSPRCDQRGNCEVERAPFEWRGSDGRPQRGALVDVHLAVRR